MSTEDAYALAVLVILFTVVVCAAFLKDDTPDSVDNSDAPQVKPTLNSYERWPGGNARPLGRTGKDGER